MSNEPAKPSSTSSRPPISGPRAYGDGHAYFLALEIENLRCFGSQRQRLILSDKNGRPARFTIILGDNGTGKTTILQLLAAMLPSSLKVPSQEQPISIPYGFSSQLVRFPRDPSKKSTSRNYVTVKISDGATLSEIQATHTTEWRVHIGPDGAFVGTSIIQSGINLNIYGYGAIRRMGAGGDSSSKYDRRIATLFDEKAELINAEEWLRKADYLARVAGSENETTRKRFETVKRLLINLFPKDDIEDLFVEAVAQKESVSTVEVFAKTPYGNVPLQTLSLGYRTMTAWMVDLASQLHERYPNSENPLAEPAIVLVDEIDLHLHPRWQRQIFQRLADLFPNTQFIVTAHSPLIVQAADNANIIVLHRPPEKDYVVLEQASEAVRDWRIDQIMTSDLFGLPSARRPELDTLIAARRDLLKKSVLEPEEEARLNELERQLTELPGGENPEEMRLMGILRKVAQRQIHDKGDGR